MKADAVDLRLHKLHGETSVRDQVHFMLQHQEGKRSPGLNCSLFNPEPGPALLPTIGQADLSRDPLVRCTLWLYAGIPLPCARETAVVRRNALLYL